MQMLATILLLAVTSVEGVVTVDGGPLPGCTITLTSASGTQRNAISDANGAYRLAAVEPGGSTLRLELSGFDPIEREIDVVVDQANVVATEELAMPEATTEELVLSCFSPPCTEELPSSVWSYPACTDYELDTALIESMQRGDRSALDLARQRYASATTYAEKHRLAAELLRRLPDDGIYWNELREHAQNALRFSARGEVFERWCEERGFPPDDYEAMANSAFALAAEDPRARPMLLEALKNEDAWIFGSAILGFAKQRDESALPAIEEALRKREDVGTLAGLLAAYLSDAADRIAFLFLRAEDREEYERARAALQSDESRR